MLSPVAPALADSRHPTQHELDLAHARVGTGRQQVADLQVRAEAAAEAYNGALAAEHAAALGSAEALRSAVAAHADARAARLQAVLAGRQAEQSAALAATRRAEQVQAEAAAAAARRDLAQLANAAYRTGGQLTMFTDLLAAKSPLELAEGHGLVNSVSAFQQDTIDRLRLAQQVATQRTAAADRADVAAEAARVQAASTLDAADQADAGALRAQQAADLATARARSTVAATARARGTAQALVARAESALGAARSTAASLEAAAAAARRAAALLVVPPVAPPVVRSTSQGELQSARTAARPDSGAAQTAIHWAFAEIGVPYSWGGGNEQGPTFGFAQGANTNGFDCSGLTLFAYGHAGIHLGHYTGSQYDQGLRVPSYADLQPGDLMFFATDTSDPATIHHVSIYIGNGRMIEAPHTGDVVKVSPARSGDFIGATRPWA